MTLTTQMPKTLNWQNKTTSPLLRQLEVLGVVVRFGFFLLWDFLSNKNNSLSRKRRAKWLTSQLLLLGPTFIKIGQSLSTRGDLIPLEYIEQFATLQDQVPPFDWDLVVEILEREFNKPVVEVFPVFMSQPIASASLGQVHLAALPTGDEVVVKVQRPGLEALFNLDFQVLHQSVRFLNRYVRIVRKYNLESIYQEFFSLLFLEIDYLNEGRNADRFRLNFKDDIRVKVPKIYWDYTTKHILTLEYLPGIKVDDRQALEAKGINLNEVIQLGVCSYLKQLLLDGFFQSDPHPGNMAVTLQGDLIFYDFGTMAEVKSMTKGQMIDTFFAVLRKDTDKVMESLIYMGLIEPLSDLTAVRSMISFLLERFRERPVDVQAFRELSDEMSVMFKQQPFRLPPQMTFILKSLMTLDGVARSLNPQYNLLVASQPFVKSITMSSAKDKGLLNIAQGVTQVVRGFLQNTGSSGKLVNRLETRLDENYLELKTRSLEHDRSLERIYITVNILIYTCFTGFSLIIAILLLSTPYSKWAIICFGLAGLWSMFLLRYIFKLFSHSTAP